MCYSHLTSPIEAFLFFTHKTIARFSFNYDTQRYILHKAFFHCYILFSNKWLYTEFFSEARKDCAKFNILYNTR